MKRKDSRNQESQSPSSSDRFYPLGRISINDPRLTSFAKQPDVTEQKRKSQIGARVSIIISVVLSLCVIVAVLLPMMLGREPGIKDEPSFDDTPDTEPAPPEGEPDLPPDTPVDPPADEPDPPAEEWAAGRLVFNAASFLAEYQAEYKESPQFDYNVTPVSVRKKTTIENCADLLLHHYYLDDQCVIFPSAYRYRRVIETYLLDAAVALRQQTPFDQSAGVNETLAAVAHAADRLADIICDDGRGNAIIPDVVIDAMYVSNWMLDAYNTAQNLLWSQPHRAEDAEDALSGLCQNTARALMILLHGYTPPKSYDNPQLDPTLQPYDEQMLETMDRLAVRLRELLETVLLYREVSYEDGSCAVSVGFSIAKFYQAVRENLPSLVEEFTDMTYESFLLLTAAGKTEVINDVTYIFGRTDFYAENCILGMKLKINFDRLGELVRGLCFEPMEENDLNELRITHQADVCFHDSHLFFIPDGEVFGSNGVSSFPSTIFPIALFTAGRGKDGNYYLKSANYVAVLTEKQYEEFIEICCPKTMNP